MPEVPARPTAGEAFGRLAAIIARLRGPDGCPWDRQQTHSTLRAHLLEEAAEVMDAIDQQADAALCEELGDLLMQPLLHAEIAGETGRFDIVDVLQGISDKLVRRHPHVFGDVHAPDAETVLRNWDAIKQEEKAVAGAKSPNSILDAVPHTLPALLLALKTSKIAAKAGFEWPDLSSVVDKLDEEIRELKQALAADPANEERVAQELGDVLFTAVNLARWRHINPELALRDMVTRFAARYDHMIELSVQQGLSPELLSPQQWEALWQAAKNSTCA